MSSATYNMLLYLLGNQYFSKRLTNEGKLKRASEFQEKFSDVLSFFCNFLRMKSNLRPHTGHIPLQAQDSVSLSLLREWSYDEKVVPSFGLMDLLQAPITTDREPNSRDPAFFSYIHRMRRMSKPTITDPRIWLWVHSSEEHAKMSAEFVKRWLPDFESMHSMYRSSKNERLDDAKTRAPPTSVFLLFLFKHEDDRASRLRANVRKEFTVLLDVPYYSDVGRYMEVKYRIYASELRMEFYFQLL